MTTFLAWFGGIVAVLAILAVALELFADYLQASGKNPFE